MQEQLSVREMRESDILSIADYWLNSEKDYLLGMGVDLQKIPTRDQFSVFLTEQIALPYKKKSSYAIIWELNGIAVGHCNVNKIDFGHAAFMHLHFWSQQNTSKGLGVNFVELCLPYFFQNLELQTIYSEPYAKNRAPHIALERCGFDFEKEYLTTPGSLNFEQEVKRWALPIDKFVKP